MTNNNQNQVAALMCFVGYFIVLVRLYYYFLLKEEDIERPIEPPTKRRRELARQEIMYELMNETRCRQNLRMSSTAFRRLCELLRGNNLFRDNKFSVVEERVAKFLHVVSHGLRSTLSTLLYRRSSETVSRHFHQVLRAIISLEDRFLVQPDGHTIPPEIENSNGRFYPYFKNCIGAIDGTHIRVKVGREDVARYRGRKMYPTTNVLAACTFDLKFTYVLPGWEGSASDARVLEDALTRRDKLRVPQGKCYFADAGYMLRSGFLTPYRNTRYHLKDMSGEDSKSASYTRWTPEMDKVMLEVLREHKALGQKEDRNFNKIAYRDVSEAMKKVYGHSFSQDKVTNRLKTLKGNLGLVLDLLNKKSGFTWNDITKKVETTPEIWENIIKSNDKYKTIRGKEIDNLELLHEIFEKDRATGNVAESAKEKVERWNEEGIHIEDVDEVESHGVPGASFESEELTHTTATSNSSKNKSKKRKVEERDALVGEIKEVKEAIEKVASAISSSNHCIRKEEDILAELMRLGLRGYDLAAAADIFGNDPVAANMLFAYPEDTRIEWVNAKLRG